MSEIRDLRPARPDEHDPAEQGYLPRLPWKWIVGLGLFLAIAFYVRDSRERAEIDSLKASILETYKRDLSPLVERHDALVGEVMALTMAAAKDDAPESKVDPRLKLDALHKGQGLYLRLKASDATSEKQIASAALDMPPDAIARCLGLAPSSAAELFARGSFLEKSWIKRAENPESIMKLRVVAEEIRQRSQRDLPFVAEALKSQWFMLVLERGENRRDAPVDVYLWDLKHQQLLLSWPRASWSMASSPATTPPARRRARPRIARLPRSCARSPARPRPRSRRLHPRPVRPSRRPPSRRLALRRKARSPQQPTASKARSTRPRRRPERSSARVAGPELSPASAGSKHSARDQRGLRVRRGQLSDASGASSPCAAAAR